MPASRDCGLLVRIPGSMQVRNYTLNLLKGNCFIVYQDEHQWHTKILTRPVGGPIQVLSMLSTELGQVGKSGLRVRRDFGRFCNT